MIILMEFRKILTICLAFILLIAASPHFGCMEVKESFLDQNLKNFNSGLTLEDPDILEMIQKVNESTLERHVQTIQDFGPHPTGSETLDEVKEYIYGELMSSGLSVRYDPWRYKLRQGENVEATLNGNGSSDGIVIVCAHYDSVFISPGADDDGSGVAAVLTIAEVMRDYEFNCTVKFVLFSGEEQGALGSHEYAREAYEREDNILGVINLDGIGYAASFEDGSNIRDLADEESNWIVDISMNIAEIYNDYIDLNIIHMPNQPIGDHRSFNEYGYATSYFLEYTLTPYYHTSEDNIGHVNISYLTKVSRLVLGTLAGMAELNRVLKNQDICISLKGTILSYPSQFIVRIENKRYFEDTANLTIHVEMKNLFTGEYVDGPYNTSSNWTFSKEISEYWEFIVAAHRYKFEFIRLEVTIEGFNDDIGLYKQRDTVGIAIKGLVLIVPRF